MILFSSALCLRPGTNREGVKKKKEKRFASEHQVEKKDLMAAHKIAHATLKGPSVVKEICIGLTLGLFAGSLWKMHHWNEQRKTRAFYDMLEKGEISVVVAEE
nr:unnamed protein product [Ananas comosus var. bracteatus]